MHCISLAILIADYISPQLAQIDISVLTQGRIKSLGAPCQMHKGAPYSPFHSRSGIPFPDLFCRPQFIYFYLFIRPISDHEDP